LNFVDMKEHYAPYNMPKNILIIGGYGNGGHIISEQFSFRFPSQIIIASRDIKKTQLGLET